jgi:eukaryotic-like serine/threonine-protein kinase
VSESRGDIAWQMLKDEFARLVELPPAERSHALSSIADDDPSRGAQLAALLAADDGAGALLASHEAVLVPHDAGSGSTDEEGRVDALELSGSTVSHYRVHEVLGSGGMGVAYRAEDTRLGRAVALKFLLPRYTLDARARLLLLDEARAASALDHPNVCTILDVGESEYGVFFAMPAYAGETVRQRLSRVGRIPLAEAVDIARQMLRGLSVAHAAGVTHRDLKPGNLMITQDGTLKILDFGIATMRDRHGVYSGRMAGTVAYMSPEQLGPGDVDHRTDLWSAGVVLYEMLTGVRPFGTGMDLSTLYAVLHETPAPPSAVVAGLPKEIDDVVAKLLCRDVSTRCGNAREALDYLERLVVHEPGYARPSHWRRLAAIAVLAVLATGGAAVLFLPGIRDAAGIAGEAARGGISIAVLPFVDTSPRQDQQHVGDGLAQEILGALSHVEGLRVPARASSFSFRSTDATVAEIGRQLGVTMLLEGTVHRDADRLRVTVRMTDAASGRIVWSQTFDRRFRDIFAVQAEIASTVARALEFRLNPAYPGAQPTRNLQAYELYLRGLVHWNRRTTADLELALEFFRQSVAHDSMYAPPYAGMALVYAVAPIMLGSAGDILNRADVAAGRALELDPAIAEAHAARGYAYHWQWRWEDAERELNRAVTLDPASATAHQWYGEHLAKMGRFADAEAMLRRAMELDPLSLAAQNDLGVVLMLGRRYDEALVQFDLVQRRDPAFPLPVFLLHRTHIIRGDAEAAADAGRRWAEMTRHADPAHMMILSRATRDPQLRAQALEVLSQWEAQPFPRWPEIALYSTLLGENDRALHALEQALAARSPLLAQLKVAGWADPLRPDRRMAAIMRALAFP